MIDRLGERVRAFVAEELSVPLATMRPETRLNHDLGCDGDDAVELLEYYKGKRAIRAELQRSGSADWEAIASWFTLHLP